MFNSGILKEALESQNVTWQFIPKRAPWYGGFWERILGLTKQTLKKTQLKDCCYGDRGY